MRLDIGALGWPKLAALLTSSRNKLHKRAGEQLGEQLAFRSADKRRFVCSSLMRVNSDRAAGRAEADARFLLKPIGRPISGRRRAHTHKQLWQL